MSEIKAPWTDEQVAVLNACQASGRMHPYTCGVDSNHRVLLATAAGWVCQDCGYTQDWAHGDAKQFTDYYLAGGPGGRRGL